MPLLRLSMVDAASFVSTAPASVTAFSPLRVQRMEPQPSNDVSRAHPKIARTCPRSVAQRFYEEPSRMTSSPLQRAGIVLIDAPPGRTEKIVSTCLVISSVAAFAFMAAAARVPMPQITAFVPAYEAALSISDLLTSVLLGQFARSGLKSLLVLACAYLFDVFVIIPHALSFTPMAVGRTVSRLETF